MIALFPGRFQPLHKGHEKAIKDLLKKYQKIVIAIGSINKPRSYKNPFTYYERKKMFEIVFFTEIKKGRIKVIGIKDYHNDEKWAYALIRKAKFDIVATGNSWTARCFKGKRKVERIKLYKRKIYCAKIIRNLMLNGDMSWTKRVNKKLVKYIISIITKNYFKVLKNGLVNKGG